MSDVRAVHRADILLARRPAILPSAGETRVPVYLRVVDRGALEGAFGQRFMLPRAPSLLQEHGFTQAARGTVPPPRPEMCSR